MIAVGSGDKNHSENHHFIQSHGINSISVAVINYTLYINTHHLKILEYLIGNQSVNYAHFSSKKSVAYMLWWIGKKVLGFNIILNQEEFLKKVKHDVMGIKAKGVEYAIIFLHWGREYHSMPTVSQRKLALELCRSGADIIIGAGSHIVQPFEKVYTKSGEILTEYETNAKEHFIAYSLGNFVSHQRGVSKYGMVLEIILTKEEREGVYIHNINPHFVKSVIKNDNIELKNRTRSINTYQLHSVAFNEFIDYIK